MIKSKKFFSYEQFNKNSGSLILFFWVLHLAKFYTNNLINSGYPDDKQ